MVTAHVVFDPLLTFIRTDAGEPLVEFFSVDFGVSPSVVSSAHLSARTRAVLAQRVEVLGAAVVAAGGALDAATREGLVRMLFHASTFALASPGVPYAQTAGDIVTAGIQDLPAPSCMVAFGIPHSTSAAAIPFQW